MVNRNGATIKFSTENESVREWLKRRPENTRKNYASGLRSFCEFSNIAPSEFQQMDRKKARNLVWTYIDKMLDEKRGSSAKLHFAALKSFYRNHDGETLPFDSLRGGKHYIQTRKVKAGFEVIPSKQQVYEILDMATSVRDRTMIIVLYESGIRVNALIHLNYGHLKQQLQEETIPLTLKITSAIDVKLRGYEDFYYTHLAKEAVQALNKYCDLVKDERARLVKEGIYDSIDKTPLFLTITGKRFIRSNIWANFKKCIRRAGFDPKTMWIHSLRKAFRKTIRKSDADHDWQEAVFGHKLPGSQQNYWDTHDIEFFVEQYEKVDFTREGKHLELEPLQKGLVRQTLQTETLREEIRNLRQTLAEKDEEYRSAGEHTDEMWKMIDTMKKEIEELKRQKQ